MIYNIGQEGSPYQELGDIQWNSLQAGDVVNVHWREEPYTERLLLNAQGSEDLPIVIQGVPGPNGELPVLDSDNATTPEQFSNFNLEYRQELGGSIYIGPPGSYPDADEIPQHITIRGFEITGAGQGNGFTDTAGIYHEYPGSAGVYVKGGDNITIADNYIHHNGMGVFSNSNHEYEITENLVIEGNIFEDNGQSGSYLRHHIYTEGVNTTVSNNTFGDKIDGDIGSLLKMRDVGVTVTGNTFGSSPGHIIDLGDVQSDAMIQAGYHTSEAFHHDNTIVGNTINAATGNIYLGGDSLGKDGGITSETYRKSVEFNDNTVHYESDQADQWRLGILRAPSTDQTFNISNNEFIVSSSTPGEQQTNFALLADGGNLNVTGPNTLSDTIAQRAANTDQTGEVTGWETNVFVDGVPAQGDTFVFDNRFDEPVDVAGFDSGEDVIEIGRNGFSLDLELGALNSDSFVFGDVADSGSAQFLYDTATGVLRFDRDGNGEQPAIVIAELGDGTQLLHTDITVVEGNSEDVISVAELQSLHPADFMGRLRDYDGNQFAASDQWQFQGTADIQNDGDLEYIFTNQALGRWATIGPDEQGIVNFLDHGQDGDTRMVGIYEDPLVESGEVEQGGPFDSQQRFQNDLLIDNLQLLGGDDYDGDGFQELYFKTNDGTAYLRALMHADGNIQYANYQNEQQMTDYLSGQGYDAETWGDWIV